MSMHVHLIICSPFWRFYWPKKFLKSIQILNNFVEPYVERAISADRSDVESKTERDKSFVDALSLFTQDKKV